MNKRIKKYRVVSGFSDVSLTVNAANLVEEGYEPIGELNVSIIELTDKDAIRKNSYDSTLIKYTQAFVLYGESKN